MERAGPRCARHRRAQFSEFEVERRLHLGGLLRGD